MLAFSVKLRSGLPVYQQLVYSAKRALVTGQIRAGDRFPAVRTLSREAGINPNTAQKVVSQLISEGLLEVRPGQGTFVTGLPAAARGEKQALLGNEMEAMIVEAKKLRLELEDVLDSVRRHWRRLEG